MRSKIATWLLLIMVLIVTVNIFRSVIDLKRQDSIMTDAQDKLQKVSEENQNLKRGLARAESKEFIEKEARNKLNLGREGEIVLILPSISLILTPTPEPLDTSPNWQRWVRLFL